ncbi:MAG: MiaB/RimO family radical SAM methylthiotransferase [Planctomycetes bacterium]|nr:MiaB/RimO family radical SAM methylthiotransferase [Planctomycetota bacterium]
MYRQRQNQLFHRSRLKTIYQRYLKLEPDPDGRVRAQVKMYGTKTMRFSYSEPALQQFPPEARHVFKAEAGHTFLQADYSQLEARILAYLSGDTPSIQVFESHGDVHNRNAADLFELAPEEITKPHRNFAKAFLYGLSYGGDVDTMKTKLFCPCPKCEAVVPPTLKLKRADLKMAEEKWHRIHRRVAKYQDETANFVEVVTDKRELPDVFDRLGIVDIPTGISHFEGRKRAYVKVQDGCILKCTYCIIPQVRPGLQSRSPDDIEEEVRRLIDNGYKEIVLTGVHVGHFGVDTTRGKSGVPPFRLWHLFERLDRIPGEWRMRLSSIEAVEINADFISAAADCEHLCPQFHPALQSGSDAVLARMRRRYSIGPFLEKLEIMRERLDNPAFTTDVIVGFPGETQEEFQQTLDACRQAKFLKIHIFPFSAREGTPAASFPDQIPPQVKKDRVRQLAALERELAVTFYRSLEGTDLEVLVEREHPEKPGWVCGTDRRYVPVELPGTDEEIGRFVTVRGESNFTHYLRAQRKNAFAV